MFEAIEIAEGDLTAHVLIEPEALEPGGRPSVRCIVEVVSEGFVGVNRAVSFELDALERFIAASESLLATDRGTATLETATPGALTLAIRPLGDAGLLQAEVSMRKIARGASCEHRLETGFEVDRESLREALGHLRALVR